MTARSEHPDEHQCMTSPKVSDVTAIIVTLLFSATAALKFIIFSKLSIHHLSVLIPITKRLKYNF